MAIDYGSNNVTTSGNITVSGVITATSGSFTNLLVNGTSFNTTVSGLLPTISNSGDNRVLTSTGTSIGVNAESNLVFDGTNLGIGITNPSGQLQVVGTGIIGNLKFNNTTILSLTTNSGIILETNGSGPLQRTTSGNARGIYAVDWQSSRISGSQVARGQYGVIGGGRNNTIDIYSTDSTIGGGYANQITNPYTAYGATICGGQNNTVSNFYYFGGTICGGKSNLSNNEGGIFIGAGSNNTSNGYGSCIVGGNANITSIYSSFGFIGAGTSNLLGADFSVICGGVSNIGSGLFGFIGGGSYNSVYASYSANYYNYGHGSIGGGKNNIVQVSGYYGTIAGGYGNTVSSYVSTICGGYDNQASENRATVCGGGSNTASGYASSVLGGTNNIASAQQSMVGGGTQNTASGHYSSVVGGLLNSATGIGSTVIGGLRGASTLYGEVSHAAGYFAAGGDAQHSLYVLRNKTSGAVAGPTEMGLDGSSARLTIDSGKVLSGTINILGVKSDGATVARYLRQFTIKNVGGTTSLVSGVITLGTDVTNGTQVLITANNSNDYLSIQTSGVNSETWRWVATVDAIKMVYGT